VSYIHYFTVIYFLIESKLAKRLDYLLGMAILFAQRLCHGEAQMFLSICALVEVILVRVYLYLIDNS